MKKLIAIISVVMVVMGCKEQPKQISTNKVDKVYDTIIFRCVMEAPKDEQWHDWVDYKDNDYTKINLNYDSTYNTYILDIKDGEIVEIKYNYVNRLDIWYIPSKHPNKTNNWNVPGMVIYSH